MLAFQSCEELFTDGQSWPPVYPTRSSTVEEFEVK